MRSVVVCFICLCIVFMVKSTNDLSTLFYEALSHHQAGHIYQAMTQYKTIIAQWPECIEAIYNLAHTCKELGQPEEAIIYYQTVLQKQPTHRSAQLGLAQCYLVTDNTQKGFALFESRSSDIALFQHDIAYVKNALHNGESLQGKRILVRVEWGLGDCIQFIRFLYHLKERGATLIVQTYKSLQPLFSLCAYIDQVIAAGQAFPAHDLQIPLLSLPYIVDVTPATFCPIMPYLQPDSHISDYWRTQLAGDTTFKIGICWEGKGDATAPAFLNKNIPVSLLVSLCDIPGVTVYSLQKTDDSTYKQLHPQLKTFDADFDVNRGAFMDTAALMTCMDLIVTIDTSIAHLAGALGCPVWILLPYRADWRWGLESPTTPWYPTALLFRQETPGDWYGVVQAVIKKIGKK